MKAFLQSGVRELSRFCWGWFAVAAVVCFHLAYAKSSLAPLIALYLYFLIRLSDLPTARGAFYTGLLVGLAIFAVQLSFFWTIFGPGAIALWLVLAFWQGVFLLLAQCAKHHWPGWRAVLLISILWTGIEYFRSECYYLRFAWLTAGNAFMGSLVNGLGTYGTGFALALLAGIAGALSPRRELAALILILLLLSLFSIDGGGRRTTRERKSIHVAGVQHEFAGEKEVELSLILLLKKYPQTDLIVLSEYTFDGPVPLSIKNWCRKNRLSLIAGGKEAAPGGNFYNTAFVIGPDGEVRFRQVKKVPIQFFKDGLPAPGQSVWASPWGKIGICICYDLGYRRVVDELVRQGAEMLVVPTMDVVDWGGHQHQLHARIAPMRAAEYGIPIFRVCSSGISQLVSSSGSVIASAPFPGEASMIAGECFISGKGRIPFDHWWGPFSVFITGGFIVWQLINKTLRRGELK